ncbi:chromate transporter [Pseudalkalibacillus hwajinpoensis]|uniref:chromate transporter n=1 Tax=Guptibacillus hwajinpoensis TaxID=208199 RepID=UPI00325B8DB2
MKQWHLFLAFLKVGMLGYGGGPSSIPLVYKEVVERYHWLSEDEFGDVLALGNTLPGPISTKMAGYIGYRVGGVVGMINGVMATILPTIVLMIMLLTFLSSFKDQPWVQGMTKAVVPVVGVMLAVLTWQFFKKATGGLGWVMSGLLFVGSLLLIEVAGIHPGILIAVILVYSLLKKDRGNDDRKGEVG